MLNKTVLLISGLTLLLSACVPPPNDPALTQDQLEMALQQTEQRLDQSLRQQCDTSSELQQQHDMLQKSHQNEAELLEQLSAMQEKLVKQQSQLQAAQPKPKQCTQVSASSGNKMVVGEVEWLWIESVNQVFKARVDTGATTSSLSAQDAVVFERDGKRWVKFKLTPDDEASSFEIEAPLVRYVRIRQSSAEDLDRRPVVRMTIRLGKLTEEAEFTLADRTQMNYPILLGREFLKDIAVVDVARKFVQPKPETVINKPLPDVQEKADK